MYIIDYLLGGFSVAFVPTNLLMVLIGSFFGTSLGMIPGIGPVNGIAMLTPFMFALGLPPEAALILFAAIYFGAEYGNAISSILLNIPGTSASIVSTFDGHPMAKSGRGGAALAVSAIASFFASILSLIIMIFFSPMLSNWAIRFGPAEYFALMIFAFSMLSTLSGDNLVKGLISTIFGLMLATVGLDLQTGIPRFTYGSMQLYDGFNFIVVTIGFFAISEVLFTMEDMETFKTLKVNISKVMISFKEFCLSLFTIVRSSIIGFVIGLLPGAGGTIATFISYTVEKRIYTKKGNFGNGDIRGVASPQAANSSAVGGALIPMLTLGIPGSETTAVMLAALMGMNITPGPMMIENHPDVFWGLIASMFVANVLLLFLNLPLVRVFVKILLVPKWILMPIVVCISCVAVYTINFNIFDIFLMTIFGLIGYFMRKLKFPLAPVILGLVLGPIIETNLSRALLISGGSISIFFDSNISKFLWILTIISIVLPFIVKNIKKYSD
jgi:putative tricarboxylic transport membrane protein